MPAFLADLCAQQRASWVLIGAKVCDLSVNAEAAQAPWLTALGMPIQDNDGVVILEGMRHGRRTLVMATDPTYLAGTLGDVGATRMAAAVQRAALQSPSGKHEPTQVIFILDGGGVRVQEGNAALLGAHRLLATLTSAKQRLVTVALLTSTRGCYGALAVAAGLCHRRLMVGQSRLGLNGPKVMEQTGHEPTFRAADAAAVEAMHGAAPRLRLGLVHNCVDDEADAIAAALDGALEFAHQDLARPNYVAQHAVVGIPWAQQPAAEKGSGLHWLNRLCRTQNICRANNSGLLYGHGQKTDHTLATDGALILALGPRAPKGQCHLGVDEAEAATALLWNHLRAPTPRPVFFVVDSPGQVMLCSDEQRGLHQTLSGLIEATNAVHAAGLPTCTMLVGEAISGGFLAFGLAARTVIALAGPRICIRAMGQAGVGRLTGDVLQQTHNLKALKEDAASFADLGGIDVVVNDTISTPEICALATQMLAQSAELCGSNDVVGTRSFGSRIWAKAAWEGLISPMLSTSETSKTR